MSISKTKISKLRKKLDSIDVPRIRYKNRPIGSPFYGNMKDELRNNFTAEEMYKAFYLNLIGNNKHRGTIIANAIKK